MQGQNKAANIFNFQVRYCNHILNYDHCLNKNVNQLPLHKGNLFLGGVGSFKQPIINNYRITAVLSILDEPMMKRYLIKQKAQDLKILNHKWIHLQDEVGSNISQFFQQTHKFIKQMLNSHNVLVHCQVGVSRSASIVIAFLMRQFNLKYEQAFNLVKEKRTIISPNQGFVKYLVEYEKEIAKNK